MVLLKFYNNQVECFVPTHEPLEAALPRTTHLCIGAHQDDIEIMAYGAIVACYRQHDKHFTGVTVTDGSGSPRSGVYANYTDEQMKLVRAKEQKLAARIGQYTAQLNLNLPSSAVKDAKNRNIIEDLKSIILTAAPQTIYTHNIADKHDTHVAVAMHVIRAVRELPADKRPRVIGMEVWRALDWLCDDDKVVEDNSPHPNLSAALLGVYDSQIAGGKRYDLASQGRRLANATFFASHAVDTCDSLAFGLDMTELVQADEENYCPVFFITKYINSFQNEVETRLSKFI